MDKTPNSDVINKHYYAPNFLRALLFLLNCLQGYLLMKLAAYLTTHKCSVFGFQEFVKGFFLMLTHCLSVYKMQYKVILCVNVCSDNAALVY